MLPRSTVVYDLSLKGEFCITTAPPFEAFADKLMLVADDNVGTPKPEDAKAFAVNVPVIRKLPSTLLFGVIPPAEEILPFASMVIDVPDTKADTTLVLVK